MHRRLPLALVPAALAALVVGVAVGAASTSAVHKKPAKYAKAAATAKVTKKTTTATKATAAKKTPAKKTAAVKTYRLTATLAPAPHTTGDAHARGSFRGSIVLKGAKGTLTWSLSFQHTSGPVTAAHIHLSPSGAVLVPLCGPCRTGQHGSFTGPIGANSKVLKAILAKHTYVNVHTKKNPAGEIRGVLHATAASTKY